MRLILLGPPGCGKGTQAKLLSRRMALDHIGTGDLLRAAIHENTAVGQQARPYVEAGQLVADEVVNALVEERFAQKRPTRFVMDGYPRTVEQARVFDAVLRQLGQVLDGVLLLTVSDEEIVRRVSGRWSCPSPGCKATYHTEKNPPKVAGVCDDCGSVLLQRADDKAETVLARLLVYHRDTAELIPYYQKSGVLRTIAGEGEIEEVFNNLKRAFEVQAG